MEREKIAVDFSNAVNSVLKDIKLIILFGSTAKKMDLLYSNIDIALIGKNERIDKKDKEKNQ